MSQAPMVIALDLDYTLAHFKSGRGVIFEIVSRFGIEHKTASRILEELVNSREGFNFHRYTQHVASFINTSDSFLEAKLNDTLDNHFQEDFSVYPDVKESLEKWKLEGNILGVVTAGNREFQQEKIDFIGFPFDEVHITDITI